MNMTKINEQGLQRSQKYRRQFVLTAAVYMEHNQNMIATVNHQSIIWIKCHDHS